MLNIGRNYGIRYQKSSVRINGSLQSPVATRCGKEDTGIAIFKMIQSQLTLDGYVNVCVYLCKRLSFHDYQVIAKARVPIIKFVEKRSGISFDIRSFFLQYNHTDWNYWKKIIYYFVMMMLSGLPGILIHAVLFHDRYLDWY